MGGDQLLQRAAHPVEPLAVVGVGVGGHRGCRLPVEQGRQDRRRVAGHLVASGLARLLAPEGRLVLSGILAEQAAEVEAAAQRNGLRLVEERQIEDWVALTFGASDQG